MQDKLFKDSKKYSTDHMSPNYTQKEYFIKRRKSSDLTSESICPTDDMSITSENFFIPTEKKQSSYINYSNENINKNNNIKNDRNQNEDKSLNGNENSGNKKQQNIYYRASKEKEKKKSVFNK